MDKRQLGQSALSIAPIVFGGNVFGWTADKAASFALLDAFVAHGFDCVDTADVYSRWVPGHTGGESETIIGEWLTARKSRSKIVIATKCGMAPGADGRHLSRASIVAAVEGSLKRLQTDHIDLYQAHKDDAATPLEETLEAFASLVKAGKVRALGASNYSAARLGQALDISEANGWPRYESLQPEYNLAERAGFEAELQPLCVKRKLGVISYYSLASGFLTGKYRSPADLVGRARAGGVKKYLDARGLRILQALDEVSARERVSQAQVALAWLMAQPTVAAPIVSATSIAQLEDILAAARLTLSASDLDVLDSACG
mgnify:FL=1